MAKKNKNTKTTNTTKVIDVDAYADKANQSARHFVALLGEAILELPKIKEKSQEAADKKAYETLDSLFDAFVKAQSDAIKFAVADISNAMGMEKSLYPLEN